MKKVLIAQRDLITIHSIQDALKREHFPHLELHYAAKTCAAVCEKMKALQPDIVITSGMYDDSSLDKQDGLTVARESPAHTQVFLYSNVRLEDPAKLFAGIIRKSFRKDTLVNFLKDIR